MKKFNLLLASVVALFSATATAQTTDNPWYISAGLHSVDHTSVNGVFDGFFDTDDYSFVPPLSRIVVARNLKKGISVDITASVGEIDNKAMMARKGKSSDSEDKFFLNVGPGVRISPLQFLGGDSKIAQIFDPYFRLGANYNKLNYTAESDATVPNDHDKDHFGLSLGAGANIWITENIALNVGADYNHFPETQGDNIDFFQHYYGLGFQFGNNDKDGDGVLNKDDNCPEVAGPAENKGCPWGDSDGDGVKDNVDNCPKVAGPVANAGCPWGDADNDGVLDNVDNCPNQAGPASNQGCPKTVKMKAKDLTIGIKGLNFKTNSAVIASASTYKIDAAAKYIKANGGTYFVDGHTDSSGKASYNKSLSQKRANAVVAALIAQGVKASAITARGFGEETPIASNETAAGKAINRRVVFTAK